ncbi:MAG: HlyD family efflux transporter periplasmic adaptor subunit [Pseudobdellovibrio sp.]
MKKIFYVAGSIIIITSLYVIFRPSQIPVEVSFIQPSDFEETLSYEGKIRSKDRQTVYAYATGTIDSLKIKFGDQVKKNQVIANLDWDKIHLVRSPMDGVISKIFRDSAGPIVRGEPLFEVSNLSDLEVVVDLPTPEAVRLKLQSDVKVLNWGGPGELPAKIFQISRAGAVKISALGVEEERTEVKLSFEKVPIELIKKFGDNYHVDVVFIISRNSQVYTVPLGALFKNGNEWAVYTIQNGKAVIKEINISKKNSLVAMVDKGLSQGDQVILFPSDKIRNGIGVRISQTK